MRSLKTLKPLGRSIAVSLSVFFATASAAQSVRAAPPAGNKTPNAIASAPNTGKTGQSLSFNGSRSSDQDGRIVSYAWDFGDGAKSTAANPTHAYSRAGTFAFTLTVTDDNGARDVDKDPITIIASGGNPPPPPSGNNNTAPKARATGPATGKTGQSLRFSSVDSSDPDGRIVSYAWDFGDGAKSSVASPTHTYTRAGQFTLVLTVTDNQGASSFDDDPITITNGGGNPPPPPPSSMAERTFFQNDWDGNDSDGRNCARDWESEDIWRYASGLYDVKNTKSAPSTHMLDLEAGANRISDLSKTGRVNVLMGGGAGQMLLLLDAVDSFGGTMSNIYVVSHGSANEQNRQDGTGQYPPYGPQALEGVIALIGQSNFKHLPSQNDYAYGPSGGNKSTDISDFGMIHYIVYGEEKPTKRLLLD